MQKNGLIMEMVDETMDDIGDIDSDEVDETVDKVY